MTRVLARLVGLGAAVALCQGSVLAQTAPPAEKPTPKVGDVLEYVKDYVTVGCKRWEVKEVNKDGFNISQCGDNLAYLSTQTATVAKIVTTAGKTMVEFKPGSPVLSFPLQVGKKWEGKYDGTRADTGASWTSSVTCEAKSFETVKVPAGAFEAFKIDCTDSWESPPFRGASEASAWYAPKVGTIVKQVNPSQSAFDYELASYAIK